MIDVPFSVGPETTPERFLVEHLDFFDWLKFLYDHKKHLFITSRYEPAPHWYIVNYRFYLDPKFETLYRLKFSH